MPTTICRIRRHLVLFHSRDVYAFTITSNSLLELDFLLPLHRTLFRAIRKIFNSSETTSFFQMSHVQPTHADPYWTIGTASVPRPRDPICYLFGARFHAFSYDPAFKPDSLILCMSFGPSCCCRIRFSRYWYRPQRQSRRCIVMLDFRWQSFSYCPTQRLL